MANKKLITESDVRAMARGAELVLGKDVIATPAALDAAFERGMRIVMQQGRVQVDGDVAQSGLWSRMHQANGTFVVEIKNGRATVTRLTDQGPVLFGSE